MFCVHSMFYFYTLQLSWWLIPELSFVNLLASEIRAMHNGEWYLLVYNLNGCSILDAAWPPSWWYSSDWRWIDYIATRASDHVCSYSGCDMVAEAAGVGWFSIRHRIPAKPASSHTAISANLPLCANNSTDVLPFWRSFQACLVCAMPQQPVVFSFPITEGTLELKSARVLSLPRNGWVIEGTQVTGFSIAWAGKCRGCG